MAHDVVRRCLVVGCADCVRADVDAAQALCDFDAVYCVKQAGIHWPRKFEVWATLHPEFMDAYEAERAALGLPGGYEIVSTLDGLVGSHAGKGKNIKRKIDYRWPGMNASASSGIFAVKVAIEDGFNRIVLAGIPFTKEAGHFLPKSKGVHGETRGTVWRYRDSFTPGLMLALPHMREKVRSMSGYTKELLGYPTEEWLRG